MEQVYHPRVSGLQTLAETRDHLIECGMSDYWADKLMRLYLSKIEKEAYLCTVLDCFTRPEAKGYLNKPVLPTSIATTSTFTTLPVKSSFIMTLTSSRE